MNTYQTKYSNLNDLTKKDRKLKGNQFPFIAANSNLSNIDLCGQKVSKLDPGSSTKFCPICDQPMIVRMIIYPCEHVICYSCTKPDTDICYVCEVKVTNINRLSDKSKLYECDYPECFRFFESYDKLNQHRLLTHNVQMTLDGNVVRADMMMNPMMRYPMNAPMQVPMQMPMMQGMMPMSQGSMMQGQSGYQPDSYQNTGS